MIKLGIIGAMAVEIESLKSQMTSINVNEHASMTFYDGKLNGVSAVLVVCGVGKVNAAICVQLLCDCYNVTHIVNTGVAGSLSAQLDIGDLVVSTQAMYHDFDCHSLNPNYPIGQVPGLPVRTFASDSTLVEMAYDAAEQVHPSHVRMGIVASGDQFVCDKAQKETIVANTGALCTEMEGAAIAHASWRNGVPFVVIRAISDKADDSAQMDYPTFEAIAALRCSAVTQLLARNIAELKSSR